MVKAISFLKKYACMMALTLLTLITVLQLWNSNIMTYPLYNEADGMLSQFTVRANMEGGGITQSDPRAGFLFESRLSDFPVFLSLFYSNTLYKAASLFTTNWVFVENLHFLLSFFLVAAITLHVLEKLEISTPIAMLGSLLYTFLPWHFIRAQMGHFAYLDYFVVPLFLFYSLRLSEGAGIFDPKNRYLNGHNFFTVLVLLLCGSVNIYFSFFGCCFLGISILFNLYRKRTALWGQAVLGIFIISLQNLLLLFPYLLRKFMAGTDYLNVYRNPAELRTYALNLSGMLLPIENHRLPFLAGLRDFFMESYGVGSYEAMGFFAAAGVIAGIFLLFRRETEKNKRIRTAAVIMVVAILAACTDGLNEIIGLFFSSVRAYNRVSIYIAFLAIFIMVSLLDRLYLYSRNLKNAEKSVWILCILAMAAGIADQTSEAYVPKYAVIEKEYISDKSFMETLDFEGSAVFQMPYVSFPEMPPVNRMKDYEQLKGYLYSDKAAFSYGVMKDSAGDRWNQWVASLGIPDQLLVLAASGYNGIYVDSFAYGEEELEPFIHILSEELESAPKVSQNGRLYYFSMQNYLDGYGKRYTQKEREYLKNLYRKITGFKYRRGFRAVQVQENEGEQRVGVEKKAEISLYNADIAETEAVLHIRLSSLEDTVNTVKLKCGSETERIEINASGTEYTKKLLLPPGTTNIVLSSENSCDGNDEGICYWMDSFVMESPDSYGVIEY